MKNVLNLIRYNNFFRRNNNISSIIFGIIALVVLIISNFIHIAGYSLIYVNIPIVAVALLVNFIDSIVHFAKSFSKENARWEFLFPIKGIEYLLSKYIEFAAFQFGFATIIALISIASNATSLEIENVALINYGVAVGMTSGFIVLTSIISIVCSYFDKTALRVILSVIGMMIFSSISEFFEGIINRILPYVYISINGDITIGIFESLVSIALIVGLVILATKHIDNKLELK